MLRSVSLDRSFYRPLSAIEYASHVEQVPEHFRFIVKAPSLVCDAVVQGEDGRGLQDNPAFLDPVIAANDFVLPAILRALRPGPLVCRWSLNARHGSYGYEEAKGSYEPFDRSIRTRPPASSWRA